MDEDKHSETKLLEISREAHKLIQMINSWTKAPNFDGSSKEITKYLMRGAFDLQESLITLKKLQEASKMMSHEKAKERELEVGEVGFGLMGTSGRFERLAMDGSLFNYIDELKKVIRGSSCSRQPGICSNSDEKVSSSRSLGFLMSGDLNAQPKKANGPNLVAKLMGLEQGFPSETDHPTRKEHKRVKFSWVEKNPELRTKTVKDIVEVVKSKAIQESDEIRECERMSGSGPRFDYEVSTNVIMTTGPQSDRFLVSKNTRATSLIPEEIIRGNMQMLSRKSERKEVKSMKRSNKVASYQKTANLASVGQQQQKKVVCDERSLVNGRKPGDRKELKAAAAVSRSQAKVVSGVPAKSDRRSSTNIVLSSNDQLIVSRGANASRKHNQASLKPVSQNFNNLVKAKKISEVKPVRNSMDIKVVTGNVKKTNQTYNLPVDGSRRQAEKNSTSHNRGLICNVCSNSSITECSSKESKSFCEAMVKSSKCNRSSRSPEESQFPSNKSNIQTSSKVELDVQLLLLSDQSFISHAQELFRLKGYQATHNQSRAILKRGTRNVELVLDCAKELMIRKRYQAEVTNHHMLQTSLWSLSVSMSLDQLLNEISNGIEKLNGYSKNVAGVSMKDGIYVRLEGDLRCRDVMLNAMWDVGWVNWVCVEEADHAVGQVEELILCGLVEELVVELVCQ